MDYHFAALAPTLSARAVPHVGLLAAAAFPAVARPPLSRTAAVARSRALAGQATVAGPSALAGQATVAGPSALAGQAAGPGTQTEPRQTAGPRAQAEPRQTAGARPYAQPALAAGAGAESSRPAAVLRSRHSDGHADKLADGHASFGRLAHSHGDAWRVASAHDDAGRHAGPHDAKRAAGPHLFASCGTRQTGTRETVPRGGPVGRVGPWWGRQRWPVIFCPRPFSFFEIRPRWSAPAPALVDCPPRACNATSAPPVLGTGGSRGTTAGVMVRGSK